MFLKRLTSTLLLWGTVLGILFVGGSHGGIALLVALSAAAQWEFYGMLARMGYHPKPFIGILMGTAVILFPYLAGPRYFLGKWELLLLLILMAIGLFYALAFVYGDLNKYRYIYSPTSLGVLYLPFMLHFLVYILRGPEGLYSTREGLSLVLWLIVVAKFTDVGGFLVGSYFGKHPFAPKLSPKKTWEGVVGGVLLALCVGSAWVAFFPKTLPARFTVALSIRLCICLSITAILSDLAQSAIKRQAKMKDSGSLLPGIGGAFDLLDSLVFTAPLGYFLFAMHLW